MMARRSRRQKVALEGILTQKHHCVVKEQQLGWLSCPLLLKILYSFLTFLAKCCSKFVRKAGHGKYKIILGFCWSYSLLLLIGLIPESVLFASSFPLLASLFSY